jgi:hypothetical protein
MPSHACADCARCAAPCRNREVCVLRSAARNSYVRQANALLRCCTWCAVLLTLPHLAVHRLDAAQRIFRPVVGDIGAARGPILLRCTHGHAAVDRHLRRR